MKKVSLVIGAAALAFVATAAEAKEKLTLQLKWVTQAQFAGYYVAKDKGFYDEVGLDVTVKAGGPDINPSQVIAGGGADVVVDWMPSALATREKGVPMVNIAQFFQKSGMMLTCRNDSGIKTPADFKGHTLGVWFYGNEYPFLSWMSKLNYSFEGANADVKVLKQGFNVDPILQKQASCVSTMTYNEYWQILDAGLPASELTVFKYEDQGVATLEDGLYALEKSLADPKKADALARFVKASAKGWQYAMDHQAEAVEIILENDTTGAQTEAHQTRMMGEIAKLVQAGSGKLGYLDPAAYQRTVDVLMSSKSTPVITKKPAGAWSHDVWNAAQK